MNAQPILKAWARSPCGAAAGYVFCPGAGVLLPQLRELSGANRFVDRRLRPSAGWQLSERSFSSWRDRSRM
jgi:hypothetical protein